jgi:hypothetical protein
MGETAIWGRFFGRSLGSPLVWQEEEGLVTVRRI